LILLHFLWLIGGPPLAAGTVVAVVAGFLYGVAGSLMIVA
jgi:hypothetical protein